MPICYANQIITTEPREVVQISGVPVIDQTATTTYGDVVDIKIRPPDGYIEPTLPTSHYKFSINFRWPGSTPYFRIDNAHDRELDSHEGGVRTILNKDPPLYQVLGEGFEKASKFNHTK